MSQPTRTAEATSSAEEPALRVEGLTKRFGGHTAVSDLSFTVAEGAIVGFLGPNGSGKTTTFRMILGLAAPTAGSAHIFGRNYRDLDGPLNQVGALIETSGYHPTRTGRQHLIMQARTHRISRERVDELLHMVGLADAADRGVGGYSAGMRQRLGLATALLGDPRLLLLDEPANGLDPEGIHWLRDFLRHLSVELGKTVVVSSHVLAEIERTVDDVIIIRSGQLVTQGPVDLLANRNQRRVVVTTDMSEALSRRLADAGAHIVACDGETLVVADMAIGTIGQVACDANIALAGLWPERTSLEDAFLDLTSNPVAEGTQSNTVTSTGEGS
jgi:ABC-2 type transport system ATP-binding protein